MTLYKYLFYSFLILQAYIGYAQHPVFSGKPNINIPAEVGNYPNTPFLYRLPVSGQQPVIISIDQVPDGLLFDKEKGILYGNIVQEGSFSFRISATNELGTDTATLNIRIGDKLCLTPPMGWNSWNVYAKDISEEVVLHIADEMEKNGMVAMGYQYINLDDYWHADKREADGRPRADSIKFPRGLKWLADHLHSRGFKLGIYSCAGNLTCGERFGSYGFEDIDARTYAEWGVDLVKYDYCHVPRGKEEAIRRYKKMGEALKSSGRSIVYSVCEWGRNDPWEWSDSVYAHYYRTTGDIFDRWKGIGPLNGVLSITEKNSQLDEYAGSAHWNDPDMLLVGNYGKGKATSGFHSTGLNDIQYATHFAIWCFFNAPLLSSADPGHMSDAGIRTLTDRQLISLNQDALGKQAQLVYDNNGLLLFKKPLSGGRIAWLLVNTNKKAKQIELKTIFNNGIIPTGTKFPCKASCNTLKLPAYDHELFFENPVK